MNTDEERIANRHKQSVTQSSQASHKEGQINHKHMLEVSAKRSLDKQHTVSQSSTKQHNHVKYLAKVIMISDLRSRIHDLEEHFNEGFLHEFEVINQFLHFTFLIYNMKT